MGALRPGVPSRTGTFWPAREGRNRMIVCCFEAPGGYGALTRDTQGGPLPEDLRPWTFCRVMELRAGKDDLAAMRLIRRQGYCLFRYAEQGRGHASRQAHNL